MRFNIQYIPYEFQLDNLKAKLNQITMQENLSQKPKYVKFRHWLESNGCKISPHLQIPSINNGCIGISTRQMIPSHQVILAVPEKLILTAEKVYKFPELKKLYANNDDLFDYQACDENQFNILAVFLMYEKSKMFKPSTSENSQPYSFWEPYFTAASECSTILDWPQSSYSDLPHSLRQEIVFFQIQMAKLKIDMINYLQKRKEFQGVEVKQLVELFDWAYRFVMTRCFGECFRTTCLIPGVDMFNHGNHIVEHQLMNINKQLSKEVNKKYKKFSGVLDLSILQCSSQTDISAPHYEYLEKQTGKSLQQLLFLDKIGASNEINKVNQIKAQRDGLQIYQMQFYSEDDREDNDTQNDEEEERETQMTFLIEQEKQQAEEFIRQYKKFKLMTYKQSKQMNEKNVQQSKNKQILKKQQISIQQKIDSAFITQGIKEETHNQKIEITQSGSKDQSITALQNSSIDQNKQKEQSAILTNQPNKLKNLNQEKEGQNKSSSNSQSQSNSQQDQDSDSDCSSTPSWHNEQGTYFSLYSQYSIHAGAQLLISYGSRTNKFLLIWYGFCYPNNFYDSVSFRLDASFENQLFPQKLIFEHYYLQIWKQKKELNPYTNVSKEFRLKRTKMNNQLVMFLRVFLMNQYKGEDQPKLMGTIPTSIEFELFLFGYSIRIFKALFDTYPKQKIEEWRKLELEDLNCKFKRIFYEQQRNIIQQNIVMAESVIKILTSMQASRQLPLKSIYNQIEFPILRKIRKYVKQLNDNIQYIHFNPKQQI